MLASSRRRDAAWLKTAGRGHSNDVGMARPAGLEPATSWFVGNCGCLASLVYRVCSSGRIPLLPGVREEIVHLLFTSKNPAVKLVTHKCADHRRAFGQHSGCGSEPCFKELEVVPTASVRRDQEFTFESVSAEYCDTHTCRRGQSHASDHMGEIPTWAMLLPIRASRVPEKPGDVWKNSRPAGR
jgi:hypothetical protein